MNTEFLPPSVKLVDAVTKWLSERAVKTSLGVNSLAHIMVIVPTAQAGRQLRFAIAEHYGKSGVLPPRIRMPMQVVEPASESYKEASAIEIKAAFLAFTRAGNTSLSSWPHLFRAEANSASTDKKDTADRRLGFLEQFEDIWHVLGGGGMLMCDVLNHNGAIEVLNRACGDEKTYWKELEDFESKFFEFLHERNLCHPSERLKLATKTAAKVPPVDVKEIVLPALVDPVPAFYDVMRQWEELANPPTLTVLIHADKADAKKFDEWGRPKISEWTGVKRPILDHLRDNDIIRSATDCDLASAVVNNFPPVESSFERPALGLVDDEIFPELNSAFLSGGYRLHNPERHPLTVSSLGVLIDLLLSVWEYRKKELPWKILQAIIRDDDMLRAFLSELPDVQRSDVLISLDEFRNTHYPVAEPELEGIDDSSTFKKVLIKWTEWKNAAIKNATNGAEFIRQLLEKVYANRTISEGDEGREFLAASKTVSGVLAELASVEILKQLTPEERAMLAHRAIASAVYQLEPESTSAVKTEGWLELAWSRATRIVLAGFHEGCVPESLIGHPFLPDRLRAALGLSSNDQRLARDTYLLSELLTGRDNGNVRAFISISNKAGDIRRPSRLLFLCSNEELSGRVKKLFGDARLSSIVRDGNISNAWRIKWPSEVPLQYVSPSAIDAYLRCPFTYLLSNGLKMRAVDEKQELGADDFGLLVHRVLKRYADADIKRGDTPLGDENEIRNELDRCFNEETSCYGKNLTTGVMLQLESARCRIQAFAPIQARWVESGWRICAAEKRVDVKIFDEFDIHLHGCIDRVDYNKEKDIYRIVDYKTWGDPGKKSDEHLFAKGKEEIDFAEKHGFPYIEKEGRRSARRIISIQLPLYAHAFERTDSCFRGKVRSLCYLGLGDSPEHVGVFGIDGKSVDYDNEKTIDNKSVRVIFEKALETAEVAISQIEANIFWPPGPKNRWDADYGRLFLVNPENDVPREWKTEQEGRIEAWKTAKGTDERSRGDD